MSTAVIIRTPMAVLSKQRKSFALTPMASKCVSSSAISMSKRRMLILYSKPGCCLCDGLKEKLHAAFSLSGTDEHSDSLLDVDLQEIIPRFSPRIGVELVRRKVADALR